MTITKKDRPVAVLLSQAEYERFEAMEDAIWSARADRARREGKPIPHDEAMKLLKSLIDA